MILIWDGLQVQIPKTMEATNLEPGFIRLTGPVLPTVDIRFAPGKDTFDPHKDGQRLLHAAGLLPETIGPCREPWAHALPGNVYNCSRLYVLQFSASRSIVAMLFSEPPASAVVQSLLSSLKWSPPGTWRRWCCYDMTFETPPDYTLQKANFQPGRLHLTFTLGKKRLIFDRLAPANVVLEATDLITWCRQNQRFGPAKRTTILPVSDTEVDILVQPSVVSRVLPWLPGCDLPSKAAIRHARKENKILIIVVTGADTPDTNFQRILGSYATISAV